MWFYDDKPYKGTCQADPESDEGSDSAGYADMITDCAFALVVVVIAALVAMGVWVYRTGGIPPWLK